MYEDAQNSGLVWGVVGWGGELSPGCARVPWGLKGEGGLRLETDYYGVILVQSYYNILLKKKISIFVMCGDIARINNILC